MTVILSDNLEREIRDSLEGETNFWPGTVLYERAALIQEIDRLRDALENEREACARIAENRPHDRAWVPGSLYDTLRRETAAAIRAKQD